MSLRAKPAFPDEPNRFVDDRDSRARAAERAEIEKQIRHLTQFPNDTQRQRQIVDRLASGRRARGSPPFAELSTGTLPALVLPEFLVRKADLERPDVQRVIDNHRRDLSVEPVAALDEKVIRLVPSPGTFSTVNAEIGGLPIAPNYLASLGGWTKGKGGPEPTASRPRWQPPKDEARIKVAVIDTGLGLRTDEWLQNLINPEPDPLYPDPNKPTPDMPTLGLAAGHGTFVAGIVAHVEPRADILMYQKLDIDGCGDDITLAETIVRAARDGARIINLSLGTLTIGDEPSPGIEAGIQRAIEINKDILVVCSAGNYGNTRRVWPAAFSRTFPENVVAVAGLNPQGEKPFPEWSSRGDFVQFSTIAEGIVSTYIKGEEDVLVEDPPDKFPVNSWAIWTGTSFAAPQIAGAIASICLTDNVQPSQAVKTLKERGTPIPDYGVGVTILPGT